MVERAVNKKERIVDKAKMFHVKQLPVVRFVVDKPTELKSFLKEKYPDISGTRLKEMLEYQIKIDGRRVSQYNYPLSEGMVVCVEKVSFADRVKPRDLDIVYEDRYLLVVNKHEGLLSNSKKSSDITLISELNRYFELGHRKCHAHIVHRLDRDTSGLMVVSKSKDVSRKFEEDWKTMVYDRAYIAVAWGSVEPRKDTITSWLTDGEYCVLSSPVDNGGKKAVTHYEVKRKSRRYSMLELHLDTGRRNQIRVHLRELGHPVVHDPMYGYKEDVSPINRLALHAFRLCFIHPVTGKKMSFQTPIPQSFERLMEL